jgi:hypothetical protein
MFEIDYFYAPLKQLENYVVRENAGRVERTN